MSSEYAIADQATQEAAQVSQHLAERLPHLFAPLLIVLDKQLDVRLVRTFLVTIAAIIQFRNRAQGLLLSELGALLTGPAHAPAGTKRLSNLLRSPKWTSALIDTYL